MTQRGNATGQLGSGPLRVGMLGLDTSHVVAFAKLVNAPEVTGALAQVRIVAACPAGNPDFPLSRDRIDGFIREVRDLGVEIVASTEALLARVDAVLLESVDGGQHLEQVAAVFRAGKPVFIDKPLAASLAHCVAIRQLGLKYGVPWFSSSSSRFTPGYRELRQRSDVGEVIGCDAYSQARVAPGHPDLFWYGVHGADVLYTVMGTGCQTVAAVQTPTTESVRGVWADGRVGTYRGIREQTSHTGLGVTVFGTKGIVYHNQYYDYVPLLEAIARFCRSGEPPVSAAETVEVFAFLEAAEESKRQGGLPVTVASVMARAQAEAVRLVAEVAG